MTSDKKAACRALMSTFMSHPFARVRVVESTDGTPEYESLALMSATRLRQDVRRVGDTAPMWGRSSDGTVAREYIVSHSAEKGATTASAEYPCGAGAWGKLLPPSLACQLATVTGSWLVRDAYVPNRMREIVEHSQDVETVIYRGTAHHRYSWMYDVAPPPASRLVRASHEVWLDQQAHTPSVWTRTQVYTWGSIERRSDITVDFHGTDSGWRWDVEAKATWDAPRRCR
ncbi:MAG TPA: hypothetical protein VD997_11105 [Phycisphaerales bacterium]|nr:hypothetical protein [Phycisphaerales bacterium]